MELLPGDRQTEYTPTEMKGARLQPGDGSFAVELLPGDIYMLCAEAQWEWKHGLYVPDDEEGARRAVVCRILVS